jgi:hypothetical protein
MTPPDTREDRPRWRTGCQCGVEKREVTLEVWGINDDTYCMQVSFPGGSPGLEDWKESPDLLGCGTVRQGDLGSQEDGDDWDMSPQET